MMSVDDCTLHRRKLIPVGTFSGHFPEMGLTESRLRWLIFNRSKNGFTPCISRVGRRIFIDPERFLKWIDDQSTDCSSTK